MDIEEDIKILEQYTTDLFHSYKEDVILKAIQHLLQAYKEQEKVIDEIIKEFLRGTEYYFSEFDYMNKEDIKQYFINKVKENKE